MPGMPSCHGMEYKIDGTGNYKRYHENLEKLFGPDGKMKSGEREKYEAKY